MNNSDFICFRFKEKLDTRFDVWNGGATNIVIEEKILPYEEYAKKYHQHFSLINFILNFKYWNRKDSKPNKVYCDIADFLIEKLDLSKGDYQGLMEALPLDGFRRKVYIASKNVGYGPK